MAWTGRLKQHHVLFLTTSEPDTRPEMEAPADSGSAELLLPPSQTAVFWSWPHMLRTFWLQKETKSSSEFYVVEKVVWNPACGTKALKIFEHVQSPHLIWDRLHNLAHSHASTGVPDRAHNGPRKLTVKSPTLFWYFTADSF